MDVQFSAFTENCPLILVSSTGAVTLQGSGPGTGNQGADQVCATLDSGPAACAQRTASAADFQMQPVGTESWGTSSIVQAPNFIQFMAPTTARMGAHYEVK